MDRNYWPSVPNCPSYPSTAYGYQPNDRLPGFLPAFPVESQASYFGCTGTACEYPPDGDGLPDFLPDFALLARQDDRENLPERTKEPSVWRELRSLGIKIGVIVGVALLLFTLVYGLHYNLDPGMNPSVKDGDLVIFYRWDKKYHAGDLILLTFQRKNQVRRVVATAGDTIDITEEGLMVNGALQQEPGISQKTQRYENGIAFPITLGEGQVFVLGDAREGAADSRIYGPVNAKDTRGSVIAILRRRNL